MLRANLGKVVHTVKRAGTYAAKVPPQDLHKIAVHVRAVVSPPTEIYVQYFYAPLHCCQVAEFWAAGLKNGPVKLLAAYSKLP